MNILRVTCFSIAAAVVLSGCVREEETLSDNPSDPIGDPPASGTLALTAPPAAQSEATGPMTVVVLGQATASGGDGSYTFTNDAPANFPVGMATVTWSVTDGAGAQATGTQSVTVSDTTPPTIMQPPALQAASAGALTMIDIGTVTVSDLVDSNPTVTNDAPTAGYPLGMTTVTWTATDANGNSATAAQSVNIVASGGGLPVLTAPGPVTAEATAPATAVVLGMPTVTGGQGVLMIVNDAPAGGFPVGATTVTWTVTDGVMATATGTQIVTITDTTPPTITAPADVTGDQGAGLGNTTVVLGVAVASDLADPAPTVTNNAPASFPVGTTTVVWTAQDASGNSALANQTVTINAFGAELCSAMVPEFINTIYPIMNNVNYCSGCHTGAMPLPTVNGFAFPNDPPVAADFDVFRTVALIDSGVQSLIIDKATGGAVHTGGDRFPLRANDPNYVTFESFVMRARACQADPPANAVTISKGTGYEQLHKIAASLGARTPSTTEINAVGTSTDQQVIDVALDPIIDGMLNEDLFYTRIEEIYNDLLLTNRDADDRGSVGGNFDLDAFANQDFYEAFSGNERNDLREDANYGIARAPVELVKFVVQNNRPFTEIVTADYTMINPYAAVIYSNNAGDPTFPFDSDNVRANHDRDDFRPVNNIVQMDGTPVPAAGVIGTHTFLARYVTTNTNVNRKRARYVFDYFLGMDIEDLAARDALDLDNVAGDVPTYEDPQCTVCHNVMDPVAGLFTNRDNDGEYDENNTFQHTRNVNGVPRMVPAGYTMDPADVLPSGQEDTALAWLGSRIAMDDRFADNTVRVVLKGLTGVEATTPATIAFVNQVKTRFIAANYDFKLVVKDVITSDYFLARNLAAGEDPNAYADIGSGRMITPEELDRKVTSVIGSAYQWRGPNSNSGLTGRHYLLYGGIDSDEVINRTTEPTALIDGIQERIANQASCQRVAEDLYSNRTGTLFPFAVETDVPDGGGAGETAIRANIQFLHRQLLGEDLPLTDPEIAITYQLFVDVRGEGETAIPSQCRGGGGATDDNGTVLPWMAVVTYLLTDYRFVHE